MHPNTRLPFSKRFTLLCRTRSNYRSVETVGTVKSISSARHPSVMPQSSEPISGSQNETETLPSVGYEAARELNFEKSFQGVYRLLHQKQFADKALFPYQVGRGGGIELRAVLTGRRLSIRLNAKNAKYTGIARLRYTRGTRGRGE